MWMRILILLIMAHYCLIRNYYQGFLFKILSNKKIDLQIDEFDELVKLNYTFFAQTSSKGVFKFASPTFKKQLSKIFDSNF